MITKARLYAKLKHCGQKRKWTNEDYFCHPERVAINVLKHGDVYDEMVAAAYMHDLIEDTPTTHSQINELFGKTIADMVLSLTSYSKQVNISSIRALRKKADMEYLARQSDEVHIIKLYDRLDNVSDMVGSDAGFKRLYANETIDLITHIGSVDRDLSMKIKEIVNPWLNEK